MSIGTTAIELRVFKKKKKKKKNMEKMGFLGIIVNLVLFTELFGVLFSFHI